MKELFESTKDKFPPMLNTTGGTEFWATFGRRVYDKYLSEQYKLEDENYSLKGDIKILGTLISEKNKKHLSKRLLELIK